MTQMPSKACCVQGHPFAWSYAKTTVAIALSINPSWRPKVKTSPLIYNSQWTQRPLKRCKSGLFVKRKVHEPSGGPPTLTPSNNTLHGYGSQIKQELSFGEKVTNLFITSLRPLFVPSLMLHNSILHIPSVCHLNINICILRPKCKEKTFLKK